MADLMTTIGLDDRQFRSGMMGVKRQTDEAGRGMAAAFGKAGADMIRGFVGLQTIRSMIRGAATATREYAREYPSLTSGIREAYAAHREFMQSLSRDLAGAADSTGSFWAGMVRDASRYREVATEFLTDAVSGRGTYQSVKNAQLEAELAEKRWRAMAGIFEIERKIKEETSQTVGNQQELLRISDRRRREMINRTLADLPASVTSDPVVMDQLFGLQSAADNLRNAEQEKARRKAEDEARQAQERTIMAEDRRQSFRQSVEDDIKRRGATVLRNQGDDSGASSIEREIERARAIREIEKSDLDPATKQSLIARTGSSFDALGVGGGSGGRAESGRSLAAGFSDFASQVFGRGASFAGLGKGDAQKQIVNGVNNQVRETQKTNGLLVQVKDLLGGVGALR